MTRLILASLVLAISILPLYAQSTSPCDGASGRKTRASARAAGCPSRLLILFERQRRYTRIPRPHIAKLICFMRIT
jgi:hypothetical protein